MVISAGKLNRRRRLNRCPSSPDPRIRALSARPCTCLDMRCVLIIKYILIRQAGSKYQVHIGLPSRDNDDEDANSNCIFTSFGTILRSSVSASRRRRPRCLSTFLWPPVLSYIKIYYLDSWKGLSICPPPRAFEVNGKSKRRRGPTREYIMWHLLNDSVRRTGHGFGLIEPREESLGREGG